MAYDKYRFNFGDLDALFRVYLSVLTLLVYKRLDISEGVRGRLRIGMVWI